MIHYFQGNFIDAVKILGLPDQFYEPEKKRGDTHQLIQLDIPRASFFGSLHEREKFDDRWLRASGSRRAYLQGEIRGGIFTQFNFFEQWCRGKKTDLQETVNGKNTLCIEFGYLNEYGRPCNISIIANKSNPSQWQIAIARDTDLPHEEQEIFLFSTVHSLTSEGRIEKVANTVSGLLSNKSKNKMPVAKKGQTTLCDSEQIHLTLAQHLQHSRLSVFISSLINRTEGPQAGDPQMNLSQIQMMLDSCYQGYGNRFDPCRAYIGKQGLMDTKAWLDEQRSEIREEERVAEELPLSDYQALTPDVDFECQTQLAALREYLKMPELDESIKNQLNEFAILIDEQVFLLYAMTHYGHRELTVNDRQDRFHELERILFKVKKLLSTMKDHETKMELQPAARRPRTFEIDSPKRLQAIDALRSIQENLHRMVIKMQLSTDTINNLTINSKNATFTYAARKKQVTLAKLRSEHDFRHLSPSVHAYLHQEMAKLKSQYKRLRQKGYGDLAAELKQMHHQLDTKITELFAISYSNMLPDSKKLAEQWWIEDCKSCIRQINPEAKQHRGVKRVLSNLAFAFSTLLVGYLGAVLFQWIRNGKPFSQSLAVLNPKTKTQTILENIKGTVDTLYPSLELI